MRKHPRISKKVYLNKRIITSDPQKVEPSQCVYIKNYRWSSWRIFHASRTCTRLDVRRLRNSSTTIQLTNLWFFPAEKIPVHLSLIYFFLFNIARPLFENEHSNNLDKIKFAIWSDYMKFFYPVCFIQSSNSSHLTTQIFYPKKITSS
jgi:hypothetical protein